MFIVHCEISNYNQAKEWIEIQLFVSINSHNASRMNNVHQCRITLEANEAMVSGPRGQFFI